MKQEHYVHPTGLAAATTAGIIYVVCAALVSLWPLQTIQFFSNWLHGIDLSGILTVQPLSVGRFFIGLISIVVFFYIVGALYAWLYNLCVWHCKKRKWI